MDNTDDWAQGHLLPPKKKFTPRSFFYTGMVIGFLLGMVSCALAISLLKY